MNSLAWYDCAMPIAIYDVGKRIALRLNSLSIDENFRYAFDTLNPPIVTLSREALTSSTHPKSDIESLRSEFEKLSFTPLLLSEGFIIEIHEGAQLKSIGSEPEQAAEIAELAAKQMKDIGIDIVGAPSADISWSTSRHLVELDSYGKTADEVTERACAVYQAIRSQGLEPCAVHFPGLGGSNQFFDSALPELHLNEAELFVRDIKPFAALFDLGLKTVLIPVAHYPSIDSDNPAPLSPEIANSILREKLGYQGIAISESLDFKEVLHSYTIPELAKRASDKTADIFQFNDPDSAMLFATSIRDAVNLDILNEESFFLAVERIDAYLERFSQNDRS